MSAYDEAVTTLYQATLSDFVAERKRLAAELKAAGDKDAAARVAKLVRPPVSAWAVNQLWWRERKAFEALVTAARRVKVGDREASQAHRQALARLKETAARLLQEAGNAATEPTLRRVTTTLSAVAATGGFEPDAAGALSADRDPPGFEALGFGSHSTAPTPSATARGGDDDESTDDAGTRRAREAEQRRAEEMERRRTEEAERQRRLAERERLSAKLREAEQARDSQQRDVQRLRAELEKAEQSLKKSQALLGQIEADLASL